MQITQTYIKISESMYLCAYVCADLPLSPGTAAMHMILAEQTAMQASTVGSSFMFNRQTCRGNINVSVKQPEISKQ